MQSGHPHLYREPTFSPQPKRDDASSSSSFTAASLSLMAFSSLGCKSNAQPMSQYGNRAVRFTQRSVSCGLCAKESEDLKQKVPFQFSMGFPILYFSVFI